MIQPAILNVLQHFMVVNLFVCCIGTKRFPYKVVDHFEPLTHLEVGHVITVLIIIMIIIVIIMIMNQQCCYCYY